MGAKTSFLAFVHGDPKAILRARPAPDREATIRLVERLFVEDSFRDQDDSTLSDDCYPGEDLVYAGCFPGLSIVCTRDVALDRPSMLPNVFIKEAHDGKLYLHAMHSVVDWFAYAIWERGRLVRSLSLSPDHGVVEEIGRRRPIEEPYWAGKHPADPDDPGSYPLKFHPLELAEEVLHDLLGFVLEGYPQPDDVEPEDIVLLGFRR